VDIEGDLSRQRNRYRLKLIILWKGRGSVTGGWELSSKNKRRGEERRGEERRREETSDEKLRRRKKRRRRERERVQ